MYFKIGRSLIFMIKTLYISLFAMLYDRVELFSHFFYFENWKHYCQSGKFLLHSISNVSLNGVLAIYFKYFLLKTL